MNFTSGAGPTELLSLDNIREQLIRLEDTIIFLLIERAQFAYNSIIYKPGAFKDVLAWEGTWLEWFLLEIESFHVSERDVESATSWILKYSPDEHPFNDPAKLPQPIIPTLAFPSLLHVPAASHPSSKVNDQILDFYVKQIVPAITSGVAKTEDDGNYGSAATRDVEVLQALSRRIHFGMFVSESKFRSAPRDFIPHIQSNPPNREALAGLITKPEVERRLLIRLGNKARLYGGELDAEGKFMPPEKESGRGKIDVDQVVALYRDYVIPLTKDVEVEYLVHRLDGLTPEEIDKLQQ